MPIDNNNPTQHCAAVKRLFGLRDQRTFGMRARDAIGSSLGQAAFSHVNDNVSRVEVGSNVNSSVRRLTDDVNAGNRSFAGRTVNQASRTVFQTAGINPNVVPSDPNDRSIYDRGTQAGQYLGGLLIEGSIEEANLPGPISDLTSLAYIQQLRGQRVTDITDPTCGYSGYAQDLIPFAPKFGFMFMVQITFQPDYRDLGIQESNQLDKDKLIKFNYLCRRFTRPTVQVDYEEVNMYNFRTRVAKKMTYDPVNLRLYDDNQNSSMVFLEKYLKARSPIARVGPEQQDLYETQGMNFSPYNSGNDQYGSIIDEDLLTNSSGSMGGLVNENRSVLRRIDVYHVFEFGTRANKYSFLNPKIMSFEISDLDMDEGVEPASIELQLAYDSMFVHTDIDMSFDVESLSQLGERHLLSKGKPDGRQ